MSTPHINDEFLDQYVSGLLTPELVPPLEEHLLFCEHCQDRLVAAEEFVRLFRVTATQLDVRPSTSRRPVFRWRILAATGTALFAATLLFWIASPFRPPTVAPATVFLQASRGPEADVPISAGKPVRLVFDFTPAATAVEYQIQIVNRLGTKVFENSAEWSDGRLSIRINELKSGSYWVRIYHKAAGELIAEYGLRSE